jgi:hypothetical protein
MNNWFLSSRDLKQEGMLTISEVVVKQSDFSPKIYPEAITA